MTPEEIKDIVHRFSDQNVLVVGDAMIDSYMWGHIDRMSPEAPVPVVSIDSREERLGGAANVALNVQSLGATPFLCSVVGEDLRGELFVHLMQQRGLNTEGILSVDNRPTTVKTRIISDDKHVLRVDQESTEPVTSKKVFKRIKKIFKQHEIHVIIFEDYNKGLLTPDLIAAVIELAHSRGIPVAVDPKRDHYWAYQGVDLFKPNWKELNEGLESWHAPEDAAKEELRSSEIRATRERLEAKSILCTLSEYGVQIQSEEEEHHFPVYERTIVDVSGAGDSVISAAALVYAQGVALKDVARFANLAGGLVCEHVGVVPIDRRQLRDEALRLLT